MIPEILVWAKGSRVQHFHILIWYSAALRFLHPSISQSLSIFNRSLVRAGWFLSSFGPAICFYCCLSWRSFYSLTFLTTKGHLCAYHISLQLFIPTRCLSLCRFGGSRWEPSYIISCILWSAMDAAQGKMLEMLIAGTFLLAASSDRMRHSIRSIWNQDVMTLTDIFSSIISFLSEPCRFGRALLPTHLDHFLTLHATHSLGHVPKSRLGPSVLLQYSTVLFVVARLPYTISTQLTQH
jgi:hypothetical protein